MFTIFLIIKRLSLSIFAFAHVHIVHSLVFLITFFHYVPHVLILKKKQNFWKIGKQIHKFPNQHENGRFSKKLDSKLPMKKSRKWEMGIGKLKIK